MNCPAWHSVDHGLVWQQGGQDRASGCVRLASKGRLSLLIGFRMNLSPYLRQSTWRLNVRHVRSRVGYREQDKFPPATTLPLWVWPRSEAVSLLPKIIYKPL